MLTRSDGRRKRSETSKTTPKGHNLRRRLGVGAAGVVLAAASLVGVLGFGSSPAYASADGCHVWTSPITIVGHVIPEGDYCFGVVGTGTTIDYTTGSFITGVIYDYSEVVRFYDSRGNNYATFYEPEHYGNAYDTHNWTTNIHGTAKAGGRVCGSLTSSGAVVVTVCEGIS
jgi:hypothetical protein